MTGANPFDAPPAAEHESHLVLSDGRGALSLWPAWKAVPEGWHVLLGPAPHARCLDLVGAELP
ncbi:MbtH family NRPS accessory protein [Streptomyces sp. NPDC058751]|uniref:MbtH family NRPS accessory protein n=1 Tax=Streptomyces sp. NPDC058751 TaxID=3346623 RepID=UPI0036892655